MGTCSPPVASWPMFRMECVPFVLDPRAGVPWEMESDSVPYRRSSMMWIPGRAFDSVPNRTRSIRDGSSAGGSLEGMRWTVGNPLAAVSTSVLNGTCSIHVKPPAESPVEGM